MESRSTILLDLELAFAFDRRAFEGIAALANERGGIRLVRRLGRVSWTDTVRDRQIDAVLVPRLSDEERAELIRLDLPFVCLADIPGQGKHQYVLAMDEKAIGRMAAHYFIEAQFQDFAVFARPNVRRYLGARITAFVDEVEAAGYECIVGPPVPATASTSPDGELENENGWEAEAEGWLKSLPKPLAVFAPSDAYAQVAVNAGRNAGLRIPDDLAVIGVDDDDVYCMTTSPQLSSIVTPARQMGQEALALILDVLSGKEHSRRILIPPAGVTVRGSTSDFALQDQDVIAAVRFIRDNAARGVTVNQVAEHVLLSLRTLERRFLQTLSHTVQDEIRRAKINRAKRFLVDTDLPYAEVARRSGIVQQSQLNRLIKAATGQTPKQFREAARRYRRT